jgi:hypothetical protein
MKNITLTLLTAAAIGTVSIVSASAMPFNNASAALGESDVQGIRFACDRYQRCYNTARTYHYARPYYAPRDYNSPGYYGPGYGYGRSYGYYGEPSVGIGIGPFGFRAW